MNDYSFVDRGSKVGVVVNIFDYVEEISKEMGISRGRVEYVLEYMVMYSSYMMGIGNGFRYRFFMIYPDIKFMGYKGLLEGDGLGSMLLDDMQMKVYCSIFNISYIFYREYRNRSYLMKGLGIRERKRILSRMRYFEDMYTLYGHKKRRKLRDRI